MAKRSEGQAVLESWAAFIASWVSFPDMPARQNVIMALWAMHTWFLKLRAEDSRLPITTYLHIRSDGPGQGKSTLLEVIGALVPQGRGPVPTLRPLSVVRDIQATSEEHGIQPVYLFDQIEALARADADVDDGKALLLSGYRFGGVHVVLGKLYSTFCAKAFASVGDIQADDLRSRCVVVRLAFGKPARDWTDAAASRISEAAELVRRFTRVFPDSASVPAWCPPTWLTGRDREIWAPLWSVAMALDLDGQTLMDLRTAIDESCEIKRSAERRSYRDLMASAGAMDQTARDAERLLRDVVALLPVAGARGGEHTGDVHTAWLLDRLASTSWRVYQGTGLTANSLAGLLGRFLGVDGTNKEVRMVKGRAGKLAKGYSGKALRAALSALDAAV